MIKKKLREIKFLMLKLLRIKDNAHSIALGFTLGLLINFIPSFGMGPVISTACAKLFKGNPFAGLVGGVFLIWAFPFFFYLNYLVGHIFFSPDVAQAVTSMEASEETVEASFQIGKAFIIGMMINLIIFGILIYSFMNSLVKKHRNSMLTFIHKRWNV